jgi:hypothetical protein
VKPFFYRCPTLGHPRDPVLEQLLQQRGMMAHIASHLGLTRQAVSKWRSVPEQHVPTLSKLLGVPQYKLRRRQQEAASVSG